MEGKIPLAFVAGLLSFVTPCVLPLVPGYLSAVSGVQIGIVNLSDCTTGVQIGLINYTHSLKGIQIGLLNIQTNRCYLKALPLLNVNF